MLKRTAVPFTAFVLALFILFYIAVQAGAEDPPARKRLVSRQRVTLDLVDVELATFAKFVSESTGKNLIFDDRLKGKITIMAPSGLNKKQVFDLFASVLQLKGFTLVPSGVNAYKIIPSAEARQQNLPMKKALNEQYVVRLIPLKFISPDDAVKFFTPMVSRDGYISSFNQGNFLLVIDTGLNIEKIMDILDVIDVAPPKETGSELVMLKYASADNVARILNESLPPVVGRPAVSKAIPDPRLNAVILLGPKSDKDSMKRLIGLLDVPAAEVQGGINVYFLKHASAVDLAETLRGLITGQAAQAGQQARPGFPAAQPAAAGGATISGGKMTITPDKATNSLVIAASQSDYENLVRVIKKLDRERGQVFVQAMIVEASVNRLRQLGTNFRTAIKSGGAPILIGGVGTINQNSFLNIISGLSGLTLGGVGNLFNVTVNVPTIDPTTGNVTGTSQQIMTVPGYAALFSLSQFRDAVNVLSTPQILTSDNQEAEVVVGENVPFISGNISQLAAATTVASTVERKDVGIKLKITPHITVGDQVRLDIYQEISAIEQPPTGTNATQILTQVGPSTTIRSTKTSVSVNNGDTIVISGLISERDETSTTKVPILGDIPILGYLFKTTSVQRQKTNLLVFISPTIIKNREDIKRISEDKKQEFESKKPTLPYKAGELIIKFKDGVSENQAEGVIARGDAQVIRRLKDRLYLIRLKPGEQTKDSVGRFQAFPQVKYVEPNYIIKLDGSE